MKTSALFNFISCRLSCVANGFLNGFFLLLDHRCCIFVAVAFNQRAVDHLFNAIHHGGLKRADNRSYKIARVGERGRIHVAIVAGFDNGASQLVITAQLDVKRLVDHVLSALIKNARSNKFVCAGVCA